MSCLSQSFTDFEIFVVDSGSTDETRNIVQSFADPRIILIVENERRGVCPARNLGIQSAKAKWLIFLDSDNEFLNKDSLSLVDEKIQHLPGDIDQLRFVCKWGTEGGGSVIELENEVWDYEGFLKFLEKAATSYSETFSCISRRSFEMTQFPNDRSYENLYHMDFAKKFKTQTFADTIMIYHVDSPNQNSFTPNPKHWIKVAPDNAKSMDLLLAKHGPMLKIYAPTAYLFNLRSLVKYHFLSGNRMQAVKYLTRYLRKKPFSKFGWGLFAFGILGPKTLATFDSMKTHFRKRGK